MKEILIEYINQLKILCMPVYSRLH